jgi:hypothetical protein
LMLSGDPAHRFTILSVRKAISRCRERFQIAAQRQPFPGKQQRLGPGGVGETCFARLTGISTPSGAVSQCAAGAHLGDEAMPGVKSYGCLASSCA